MANKEHASIHFHNSDVNSTYTEVSLMDEKCSSLNTTRPDSLVHSKMNVHPAGFQETLSSVCCNFHKISTLYTKM